MSGLNAFEIELIGKIAVAKDKIGKLKRTHPISCPTQDPHHSGRCTCGADEHNRRVDEILSDLDIKQ